MSTIPGSCRNQGFQSQLGSFSDQTYASQYRLNPLAATRPGGCTDVGGLHCSIGESRSNAANILSEPLRESSPAACAVQPVGQAKSHDIWSGLVQHSKSSLKEVDMTKYFMMPKSFPDGYNGLDVTLNKPSRLLSSIAASQGIQTCGKYRSYGKYA